MHRVWLLLGLLLPACGGTSSTSAPPDPDTVVFAFRIRNLPASEEFRVAVTSPAVIAAVRAQLALPVADRRLFPNGPIAAGNGGHNLNWGWHYTGMELAQLSIELCDGTPSLVQADLAYWLGTVKRFCPWSAYAYAEVR